MDRKEFHQLLKRYVKGTCTEEEVQWIDHWYELLYDKDLAQINDKEWMKLEKEMWENIQGQVGSLQPPDRKASVRKMFIRAAAAAAILVLAFSGIMYWKGKQPAAVATYEQVKEKEGLEEIVNNASVIKVVQLEDGSTVTLQPASKIAFPGHFAEKKREVYLEGEAFFDVQKNPSRPFFVYNGKLVTQVLGTSFSVKVDPRNNQIMVAVKTGKVAVYENTKQVALNEEQKKANGVIITPNQKVTYKPESHDFITSLVDTPEPVLVAEKNEQVPQFVFDETPIDSVLQSLEKVYGIEIMVESENIYNCPFTGNITGQPLYNKLELICQSIQASYDIKGTKILIKGKGCN